MELSWISYDFSYLGFLINMILAYFDPEVITLLESKFQLKSTKDLERDVKIGFQDGGCGSHLELSIGSVLAILCLLGTPMLLIKFQFNWIIEETSKI